MLRSFWASLPVALVSVLMSHSANAQSPSALDDLSDEQLEQTVNFAIGNAIFALYQEASRMLVSDLKLPVSGESKDSLPVTLMLEANEEWLDRALVDGTDSWYLAREVASQPGQIERLPETLLPTKGRDIGVACLMAGRDAEGFKQLTTIMGLTPEKQAQCVASYPQTVLNWSSLLKPHVAPENAHSKFVITYEKPRDPSLDLYATIVKESQVLDLISRSFGAYTLSGPVKLTAKSCGRPDVYWSAEKREITYCYELTRFHGELIANHLLAGGGDESGGSGEDVPTTVNADREI